MKKEIIYNPKWNIGDKAWFNTSPSYGNWYECRIESISIEIKSSGVFVLYLIKYTDALGREQKEKTMSIYSAENKDRMVKNELIELKKRYQVEIKLLGKRIKEISKTEV